MPPCSDTTGRPLSMILDIYRQYLNQTLSDNVEVEEGIWISQVSNLSLQEYIQARSTYCLLYHRNNCKNCESMIKAAHIVLQNGICSLSTVFRAAFPHVTYIAQQARCRLLQMPLAAIRMGTPSSGHCTIQITEYISGLNYSNFAKSLRQVFQKSVSVPSNPSISKEQFQQLLAFAHSHRERETLTYAVCKASGLTATGARRMYGLDNIAERMAQVEESFREAQTIRENIEELAAIQVKAMLESEGHVTLDNSSSESESSDSESESKNCHTDQLNQHPTILNTEVKELLISNNFNWFSVLDNLSEKYGASIEDELEHYYTDAMDSPFTESEKSLLEQSHEAYLASIEEQKQAIRQADCLNGMIVTDSESDDPDDYLPCNVSNQSTQKLVAKKTKSIYRRARYLKAKQIAERNFLSRKTSRKVRGILREYPDIGEQMEKFVQERNIGADAWRRTGVLTFDGNTRVKSKVTYERLRQHLMSIYNRHFSYGAVVQLCVARNCRRRSAQRYKGAAKITSRRARKGFQLKYNPDSHWSGAFYRALNVLQYTDGRHITNINRDDAAGFRLDTMATHRLQKSPMVQGSQTTTTYTDYVNRYKSILQTTSYNFTKTETTSELCAGVVKATGVYPKNPVQHMCDLEMLEEKSELKPAFMDPTTGERKSLECIRVDGAGDEGPLHDEVQFLWTARHLSKGSIGTLVTTRSSGSSYLNKVELQNGCLALAHSNLFIPSTLGGSCISPATGKVDRQKYTVNMDMATDVYISRTNHCPCGETVINLYKGADSLQKQEERKHLLQYLKGSKKQRESLKQENPELCAYFDLVWQLRNKHMVKNVPSNYVFYLVCCLKPDCPHPVCKSQSVSQLPTWYNGGPLISYLPLPVPDPQQPWGGSDCEQCKSVCHGHFLKPLEALQSDLPPMIAPPSIILKEAFQKLSHYPPSNSEIEEMAKDALLTKEETQMWCEHLHTINENRKRGAVRAAATKRQKKRQMDKDNHRESLYYCGACSTPYQEFTDSVEDWIGCESCDSWFHFVCVGIDSTCIPENFYCEDCQV